MMRWRGRKDGVGAFGRGVGRTAMLGVLLGATVPLMSCSSFFQCQNKPACPASTGTGTGTGTTTVDYAYVAFTTVTNGVATYSLVGYNIASGALTQVANISLGFLPVAMVVSPSNGYLYVASAPGATNPGVYGFAITSTGNLTALSNGAVLATDQVGAMTISPDGNYMYTLNVSGLTMAQYTFTSAGGLTTAGATNLQGLYSCALGVGTPVLPTCGVAVSPTKSYIVASLGSSGSEVFGYGSTTGLANNGALIAQLAAGSQSGDFSVAIDGSNNAYIAQTAGISVYGLTSSTSTNRGTASLSGTVVPRSVVVDPSSKFVFTANVGTGTVSAYTTGTTTALTAVTGSPFAAPASVAAIGVDSTDSYLVAVGYSATAGVQLYSVASSGVLSALAQTAATTTQTAYPVLVAMSH